MNKYNVVDVEVVKEFPKVFANELSGLLLDRKMEFVIYLVLVATSVANSPCFLSSEIK